jgi:hypothetical protein
MSVQRTALRNQLVPPAPVAGVSTEAEPALRVVTVYQDPLTRCWATELWERVRRLIGGEEVRRQSWNLSDLADRRVLMDAVRAAAEADVLVVSVRDTRELPVGLCGWADAWIPGRAGPAGALVALIGVPPQPDAQSGRAYRYLETVARRAHLDFLPHERKLPEQPLALSNPPKIGQPANRTMPLAAGTFSTGPQALLHWELSE